VEFYHDQGGVTRGRQKLTESIKNNISGDTQAGPGARNSEDLPHEGYGAIEMGGAPFLHPKTEPNTDGGSKLRAFVAVTVCAW